MRNKLLLVAFMLALTLVVGLVPAVAQEGTTIDFWHGLTGPDAAFLTAMVEEYNATNTDGITVVLNTYTWDVFFDRWVASVAAGTPPDVVIYHINEMPQYAELGVVQPIDELAAAAGVDLTQFSDVMVNSSMWNGQLYGFPLDIHPIAMYYNVDMVEAAGLDPEAPPTTGEELLAWAKAMTIDTDGDGVIDQYGMSAPATNVMTFRLWWGLLHQNGASFINDDMSEITVNSPEAAETLQWLHDAVYTEEVAPQGQADPDADFATGKVAITFQGPWWITGFMATEGLNFDTAPVPVIFDEPGVWASSHFFGFSVQDDQEATAAAMKFAKWMVDNGARWGIAGQVPAAEAARQDPILTESEMYPYLQAFIDEIPYAYYTPSITQSTEVFAENVQTPLVVNWQAVMLGEKTVEEALASMQEGINQVLQR
jgi:multiple sugar transport system substrate-binding protein